MARAHGRRQSAAETRDHRFRFTDRATARPARGSRRRAVRPEAATGRLRSRLAHRYWTTWVFHALTHWQYGTQSGWPLSQVATGVFHSEMDLK